MASFKYQINTSWACLLACLLAVEQRPHLATAKSRFKKSAEKSV